MVDMMVERYRLVLTHDLIVDGKAISVEDPKVYQIMNCDNSSSKVAGYENHIIDELFYRFRKELKEQKE